MSALFIFLALTTTAKVFAYIMLVRERNRWQARQQGRWELLFHINEFNAPRSYGTFRS